MLAIWAVASLAGGLGFGHVPIGPWALARRMTFVFVGAALAMFAFDFWTITGALVISGLGIAYLPRFLYAEAMKAGLVEEAIPSLPMETVGVHAVYPPGRFTQPKVRAFIDFLSDRFAEHQI